MTRAFGVLAALALTVVATACGNDEGADATTSATDPAALTGRTFVSTEVTGTPIPGDGPLVVEFPEAGRIAATAGCNRAVGDVDLADGVLRTDRLASTMMACPPPRDGADAWLGALFDSDPRWTVSGDVLTLTGNAVTVSLTDRRVVDPDRSLTGTEWVATTMYTPDAAVTSVALETSAPTLTVAEDGSVSGSTGCNRFTGAARIGDGTLAFGPLGTTRMACPDPEVAAIENHVLAVLAGETTYEIDGATMRITAPNGADGLGFTAR
ncbi:META domain-containing protein [Rhodococcus phenolicus]|uniref:META domain-containing protein n=1 Tax=Rhodococcus phenolicus TaxID=263849 RepID=UPI00082FCC40|nr:META domain-containing protein [Rhodococcus phenolicus]